jgi:hypothetical protein
LSGGTNRFHMSRIQDSKEVNVEFIRLLFRSPVEEEVAHRWASRLSRLVGVQAMRLRPHTTLAEMLQWAVRSGVYSMDFVVVFEPELRMELADFLDYAEHTTFREMVEHYAGRFETHAS